MYPPEVGRILFEEWVFLQSHSWIASRTKRTFSQFIRSGALAIEAGRRGYDEAVKKAQDEVPQLFTRHGVKGMARWFATTCAAYEVEKMVPGSGLAHALLASASGTDALAGRVSKRAFILIDP
jgi:hypothetical protein